ncbi:hypothetical protein DFH27DRAFT_529094 [Peziza echinospora]|nr:hypothetical protein DFH27DRAFT_529094 [Peziza echinospora]
MGQEQSRLMDDPPTYETALGHGRNVDRDAARREQEALAAFDFTSTDLRNSVNEGSVNAFARAGARAATAQSSIRARQESVRTASQMPRPRPSSSTTQNSAAGIAIDHSVADATYSPSPRGISWLASEQSRATASEYEQGFYSGSDGQFVASYSPFSWDNNDPRPVERESFLNVPQVAPLNIKPKTSGRALNSASDEGLDAPLIERRRPSAGASQRSSEARTVMPTPAAGRQTIDPSDYLKVPAVVYPSPAYVARKASGGGPPSAGAGSSKSNVASAGSGARGRRSSSRGGKDNAASQSAATAAKITQSGNAGSVRGRIADYPRSSSLGASVIGAQKGNGNGQSSVATVDVNININRNKQPTVEDAGDPDSSFSFMSNTTSAKGPSGPVLQPRTSSSKIPLKEDGTIDLGGRRISELPGHSMPPRASSSKLELNPDGTIDLGGRRISELPGHSMPPRYSPGMPVKDNDNGPAREDNRNSKVLDPRNNPEAIALIKQRREEERRNAKKFLGSIRLHQFFRRFSAKARRKDREAIARANLPRSNTQTRDYYERMRQVGARGVLTRVRGAMSRSYSALESILHGGAGGEQRPQRERYRPHQLIMDPPAPGNVRPVRLMPRITEEAGNRSGERQNHTQTQGESAVGNNNGLFTTYEEQDSVDITPTAPLIVKKTRTAGAALNEAGSSADQNASASASDQQPRQYKYHHHHNPTPPIVPGIRKSSQPRGTILPADIREIPAHVPTIHTNPVEQGDLTTNRRSRVPSSTMTSPPVLPPINFTSTPTPIPTTTTRPGLPGPFRASNTFDREPQHAANSSISEWEDVEDSYMSGDMSIIQETPEERRARELKELKKNMGLEDRGRGVSSGSGRWKSSARGPIDPDRSFIAEHEDFRRA